MAYATQEEAEELYGESYILTSVDRDSDGEADTDAFSRALAHASSLIDSYLGALYDVPIDPAPDILAGYCIDIAIYKACPAASLTEEKRRRYEDAIAWLKDVAKGTASLGLDDEETAESNDTVQAGSENEPRLFTRTKMRGLL